MEGGGHKARRGIGLGWNRETTNGGVEWLRVIDGGIQAENREDIVVHNGRVRGFRILNKTLPQVPRLFMEATL